MTDEVGKVIQGTEQETNAQTWREFFLRPENLSTALVLVAGLASPRDRGQSKLGKGLQAGVGALAFRGGIEKNLASQRRQTDLDEIAAAESAATITAGQERTGALKEANRISSRQVEQQGQPRPLNPSEKERNLAQAGQAEGAAALSNAQARALSVQTEQESSTFQRLFLAEQERVAIGGGEIDISKIAAKAAQLDIVENLFSQGKISPGGLVTLTPEDVTALAAVGINVPDIDVATGDDDGVITPEPKAGAATDFEAIQAEIKAGRERQARPGPISPSGFGRVSRGADIIAVLKRKGKFANTSDEDIELALARAIQAIRTGNIESMSISELQEIVRDFGAVLDRSDQGLLRRVWSKKAGAR